MQDSRADVFDPANAAADDSVLPVEGGSGDIASSNPGVPGATSADFPDKLVDRPDRWRSFADDNHAGVGAGMRAGCRPFVEDDKQRIERPADSNDNGDLSSGGSEHPGGFLSGNTSRPDPPSAQIDGVFGPRKTTRLCGVALSTRLLDRLGWIGDRLSLGPSVYVRIYNAFGNKSDKIDACKLADLLRGGYLRSVYHGENGLRTLKELARSYLTISKDLTRVMNRVKALYRSWGILCGGQQVYAPRHRTEWLNKIGEAGVRRRAEFFYQQLDALRELRQAVRKDLLAESRKQSATKLLRQVPSIGPIRAALLIALIQTPHRFRTKRQLWTYSGLAIETRDSAQYHYVGGRLQRSKKPQQLRGLNQNHNHDMKGIFKSAASMASSREGAFHDFYQGLLTKGMKPAMARLTLARKIAAITLILWKKGAHFDAKQLKQQAA